MASYVIATVKSWNIENAKLLAERFPEDKFVIITEKEDLTVEKFAKINPLYAFFPHWSWLIPESIYEDYTCVVFHMTDLPFGRGGSPLQNLIVRGIYHTKVSALKVEKGLDTGDIYLKESIDISTGNADRIFSRISDLIFNEMIPRFLTDEIIPIPQEGEATIFQRRLPEQSEIPEGLSQRQIYDYIRMLDGEGYPAAYKTYKGGKIYYRNARIKEEAVYAEAEFRRNKK